MKDIFLYGLSGAGKDTISDYLRDNYDYLKMRIAGTIKQYVFETYGFETQEQFEKEKRANPEVRTAHNIFGKQYDQAGIDLCGSEGTDNRIIALISRNALEFESNKGMKEKPLCIIDVRTMHEAKMCLAKGMFGIFLTRRSNEFADKSHKTEKSLFNDENGDEKNSDFLKLCDYYSDRIVLIRNHEGCVEDNRYNKLMFSYTAPKTEDTLRAVDDILENLKMYEK